MAWARAALRTEDAALSGVVPSALKQLLQPIEVIASSTSLIVSLKIAHLLVDRPPVLTTLRLLVDAQEGPFTFSDGDDTGGGAVLLVLKRSVLDKLSGLVIVVADLPPCCRGKLKAVPVLVAPLSGVEVGGGEFLAEVPKYRCFYGR
jgi:hypothetical protein